MNELREARQLQTEVQEIKDKYPILFNVLCQRYDSDFKHGNIMYKTIWDLFRWENTPEKSAFWMLIARRLYDEAKEIHPEYFEQSNIESDNKPIEQTAGLTEIEEYFRSLPVKAQIQTIAYFRDILKVGWEEKRKQLEITINEAKDYKNLIDSGLNSFR